MNDYKELIERLNRSGLSNGATLGHHSALYDEAADAIAQLVRERDAAVADSKTEAWWVIDDLALKYGFGDNQVKMARETALKMAAALLLLGAGDIEKSWLTATENFANVKSAYDKGYHDGMERSRK